MSDQAVRIGCLQSWTRLEAQPWRGGTLKKLEGKTVLVTGASAGIGRATVRAFAKAGARVIAVGRSHERLEALSLELGGEPRVLPIRADVSDGPSMEALAARVLSEVGVPDVVVANAGVGLDALVQETSDAAMRCVLEVNVIGVLRTVRPFIPGMVARRCGRILLVSSVVGKRGIPHYAGYSASKFALHGLADALRSELVGTGVSAGIICPSSTESEFQERRITEGTPQRRTRVVRHTADSVARAIVRMSLSRRREVVLSAEGKLMVFMNTVAPRMLDRILARVLVEPRR